MIEQFISNLQPSSFVASIQDTNMNNKVFAPLLLLCALPVITGCGPDHNAAAVSELQTQVATLEARDQIRDLFANYGRTLDSRDFKAFGALYARESEYAGGGGAAAHGPAEIADQLEKALKANAFGANLHVFSNEKIDVHGDSATALSRGAFYVQDAAGQPTALIYATYKDELVREEGQWKFKRREVIGDIPGPSNEEKIGMPLPKLSGDWVISSSVGGKTPITVYCSLTQSRSNLSGTCTPEMAKPTPSALMGNVSAWRARWGYDVVFNGKPGRVDFTANKMTETTLEGTLSLSGTEAPFTAMRK
jgi:hypothetical protein